MRRFQTSRRHRPRALLMLLSLLALIPAAGALGAVALASTHQWKANVTGSGPPNDVVYFQQTSTGPGGWLLDVRLPDGHVLSAKIPTLTPPLTLVMVGNVDGRPGDELFVNWLNGSYLNVSVFTYYAGQLVFDRTFGYSTGNPGDDEGIVCSARNGRHFITQYGFTGKPLSQLHWTRREWVYVWSKGHLPLYAKSKPQAIKGAPPRSESGIGCGHRPTGA